MKNHYLFNKLKAEGRPPPPFACVSAFCAGVATHTEYNIYCTTTGILPVFSTMLKATAHESYTPLPRLSLAFRAGHERIHIHMTYVNMLVLHNLAPFARQVAYFIRKNA